MKCNRAKTLIHLDSENMLDHDERERLRMHVESCEVCKAYAQEADALLRVLATDSQELAAEARTDEAFERSLHATLLQDRGALRRPSSRRAQWQSWDLRLPARVSFGLQAVALTIVALIIGTLLLTPPTNQPTVCRFSHVAAFDTHPSRDGRVYASLTQHGAVCRPDRSEGVTE